MVEPFVEEVMVECGDIVEVVRYPYKPSNSGVIWVSVDDIMLEMTPNQVERFIIALRGAVDYDGS